VTRRGAAKGAFSLLVPAMLLMVWVAPEISSAAPLAARTVTSSVSTIDRHPDTPGTVVITANNYGYVAWQDPAAGDLPDKVMFCVIPPGGKCTKPVRLANPPGTQFGVTQAFPVLGGDHGVVYVVGPRYVPSDTVIWVSRNGGKTFSAGHTVPAGSYAGDTTVDDVLRLPDKRTNVDYFVVASNNVGLGFSLTGDLISKCITCSFSFGAGGVAGATLGLSGTSAVEGFWNDADTPTVNYYWSKYDDVPVAGVWHGPIKVSDGDAARLASGPRGLFLLSQDLVGNKSSQVLRLDVRKWNPSTHAFDPPTVVVHYPASTGSTELGGLGEDSKTGALYVAWEAQNSKGDYVLQLWTSTNGGKRWSAPVDVAATPFGFEGPVRVAINDGRGFLTFNDDRGLELVTLDHL
jgi:hypothetical protein